MPFTMVATDFDDTLVPIGSLLSDRNRAALDRVRAAGVTVAIVSGRTTHGLGAQLRRNQVDPAGLYLVGYNGAQAVQAWDGKPLFAHQLDLELARRVATLASTFDVSVMMPEGPSVHTNRPDHFAAAFEAESNDATLVELADLSQLSFAPHKVLLGAPKDELVRAAEALRAEFGAEIEVVLSADFLLEVTAKGVHKGEALAGLARGLGIDLAEVVVFGDNHNDVPMFGMAGLSVAVANAVPELLQVADRITAASADDGVAQVLDELFVNVY